MSDTDSRWSGRRLVFAIYLVVLGVAGTLGLVLGALLPVASGPDLFFLVSLPATPLGFATYGVVTVAVALGVPLALVAYVSRRVATSSVADKGT